MNHGVARGVPAAVLGTALVAVLAACGSTAGPAPVTTVPASVVADKAAPPDPVVVEEVPVWPLTGVPTEEVADRPALAVKVENSRASRPQHGLEDADMVWEEIVEGGISRFVAVFHSSIPERVEPVRSVRPTDPAVVAPLDGIFAYSGAQQPFINDVRAAGIQSIIHDAGGRGFSRDPNRPAPHNLVGVPETFLAQDDGSRTSPPPEQLAFAAVDDDASAIAEGVPAQRIDLRLSAMQQTVWDWDTESARWLRSDGAAPSMSASGERHAAANVVVLEVQDVATEYRDPLGLPVREMRLVGSGSGAVASGGHVLEVTWSKGSLHDPVELTVAGEPVLLEPGATWLVMVPASTGTWTTGDAPDQ